MCSTPMRGGALRARAPRRRRRRSPSRPGCPLRVRRAHALLPAPSALYRAAPREEEIDLSLPELFATRPFNRPGPGRPRPPHPPPPPPDRGCVSLGPELCGRCRGPGRLARRRQQRASVQCAQPPVGGEWGVRGAPPAGLEGVQLAELAPARPRDAGSGPRPGQPCSRHSGRPGPGPKARQTSLPAPRPPYKPGRKPRAAWNSDVQLPGCWVFEV